MLLLIIMMICFKKKLQLSSPNTSPQYLNRKNTLSYSLPVMISLSTLHVYSSPHFFANTWGGKTPKQPPNSYTQISLSSYLYFPSLTVFLSLPFVPMLSISKKNSEFKMDKEYNLKILNFLFSFFNCHLALSENLTVDWKIEIVT